jgi:hemerythrin-like domain-containing protein
MPKTLDVIHDEHCSIAAVLHGMQYLVERLRLRKAPVEPRVFRAMLYYLDTFTERVHHMKEDKYLFGALRGRAEALIAGLEKDHAGGEDALRRLEQCLLRYEEGGDAELDAFVKEAGRFVDSYWEHMRKEEEEMFPLALELLTAEDWAEIDRAFEENRDPLAAERETRDYERLFTRIVSLAPPPIGLGLRD